MPSETAGATLFTQKKLKYAGMCNQYTKFSYHFNIHFINFTHLYRLYAIVYPDIWLEANMESLPAIRNTIQYG